MVAVAIASVAGLAWLGERAAHRRVTLILGKSEPSRFRAASDTDRTAALEFLRRDDVQVASWTGTGESSGTGSEANLRVWAVPDSSGRVAAALVGSANLTLKGLFRNVETCAEAAAADLRDIDKKLTAVRAAAWGCRDRIVGYLDPPTHPIRTAN